MIVYVYTFYVPSLAELQRAKFHPDGTKWQNKDKDKSAQQHLQ